MFKIGDFSRFSRVSIKMLRHYDEIGLLKPAQVDQENGYRYYTADQLPRLNRIIVLKDLGFTLEQIKSLLDISPDELRGMLLLRRGEVERRIQKEQARLAQIDSYLDKTDTPYDVVLREVPSQIYATIRATLPELGQEIQFMFEELETYVAGYSARAHKPPLTIFHDADYHDTDIDVEVAVPVDKPIPNSDRVIIREIPGCATMACVIHTGSYRTIAQASTSLFSWVDTHDYEINGALREVYLRFGADNVGYAVPDAYLAEISDEFVTELQLSVQKRNE